jgi:hypothetical protein
MGRRRPHPGEAIMRRRRRGASEWAALIDQWKQSGLDLPEYCQQQGLNRGTMQGWVYKSALKRAIEAARRDGRDQPAKSLPESTPAEPAPSPAFLPVRSGSPKPPPRRNGPSTAPRSRSFSAGGGALPSGRGSMSRRCAGSSRRWSRGRAEPLGDRPGLRRRAAVRPP